MGKLKKKFKKKINPEKSNKMIIAVTIGLVTVIAVVLLVLILSEKSCGGPVNKKEAMENTLKYLKGRDGISQLKFYPEQNKIVLIYEGYKENRMDFPKVSRFAGIAVSNKIMNEELTFILAKDKEENAVRSFTIKNGLILAEKILTPADSK